MRSSLECIPCFVRQALEAARAISDDTTVHERIMREVLLWIGEADLSQTPPSFAQHIHRRIRAIAGDGDPYKRFKEYQNRMALRILPELRAMVKEASCPLEAAVRLAIAGNAIDMGSPGNVNESSLHQAIRQALERPLCGDYDLFCQAVEAADSILYLTDNAGEIVLDLLLVEQLGPERVTVGVRGAAVLNDATLEDAHAVGLHKVVEVIANGSDAPGTLLTDCSEEFRRRFEQAELVIAKGQGNFESLSDESGELFFLFKVKCQVIAKEVGMPVDSHVVKKSPCRSRWCRNTHDETLRRLLH